MSILDILAEKEIINKADVARIKGEAQSTGASVEELLIKKGISEGAILDSKGEYYGIPTRDLDNGDVPSEVLDYIPEEAARHYKFVPLSVSDGVLEVGTVDPDIIEAKDALNFISNKIDMPFKLYLISETDFQAILTLYTGTVKEVNKALSELEMQDVAENLEVSGSDNSQMKDPFETNIVEDTPVAKIVNNIIETAVDGDASDIHFEPTNDGMRVRVREDGILHTSFVFPKSSRARISTRIKILAGMKLDEKRKPQDGRFSVPVNNKKIDLRVSTFPTYYGEKIVVRILDQSKGVKKLEEIGLSKVNLDYIRDAIKAPYGMILISGPTGSGKSTTLYSMMNELDKEELNILSLEDPIEYNMDGINQSQVHAEIGYTFATGLRTTLRQDPDVIMVGEIRDKETAQLAIQAALTGHLVLATIHTNTAVGVIPRLIDMGVDPYLIAPTLILCMAQRLVRTLCPGSGTAVPIENDLKNLLEKQFKDLPEEYRKVLPKFENIYTPQSTPECPTGLKGRTVISEAFKMDKDIERLILSNPTDTVIFENLRKKGMLTMKEDAIIKALGKIIPFSEVGFADYDVLDENAEVKQ